MLKSHLTLLLLLLSLSASSAVAGSYNYLNSEQLYEKVTTNEQLSLLDIQYLGAYKAGHFPQAIVTYAYPVKTAAERAKIDAKLATLQPQGAVVILSRRGGGGAMRAYDHLKNTGIADTRLFILKGGMKSWSHKELLEITED